MVTPAPVRCAIYTRKSTDENMDNDFNSLDAQREAAQNYIRSQQAAGWLALSDRYDDGAYTGANMDRPALQRLLGDVRAGRVDIIVIYKIDRLSRCLLDFAKLVEELERHKVSLVAVTQQFNTTTSMGRLTLNVLLSFAQFEREQVAERIRDKIAATRKKGKYIGGVPPLGYDVDRLAKRLVVSPGEALLVRQIFRRFLELGCAVKLIKELNDTGCRTKGWVTKKGTKRPGQTWHKNNIYRMLRNPLYIGKVEYKGEIYAGEHEPIIDQALWDQVQKAIAVPARTRGNRNRSQTPGLLKGILRCGHCGTSMAVHFTERHGRQYRYYVCHNASSTAYDNCPVKSVAAGIIEDAVKARLRRVFRSPEVIKQTLGAIRRKQNDEYRAVEVARFKVEEELAGINACGQQLVQSLRAADTSFVRGELDRLDRNKEALQTRLAELDEQLAVLGPEEPAPEAVSRELTVLDNIWDNLFPGEQQRLVQTVIEQATLYADRLELVMCGDGVVSVVGLLVDDDAGKPSRGRKARGGGGGNHTVTIPLRFKKRGGRREIVLPPENPLDAPSANKTFVFALARAFRWRDLMETGKYPSILALAKEVGIDGSYLARQLHLTLLAPKTVEAILAGEEPDGLSVRGLKGGVPARWDEQGARALRAFFCQ
jgi:site-specific DNA recombinase